MAGENADRLVDQTMTRSGSKSGRVLERSQSERTDSVLDDPDVDPEITRLLGARTGLWVPLVTRGGAIGVIAAHDKLGPDARFSDNDLRLAETFATRAAVAVDLSERFERDAFRRVIDALELERRRLSRELHDETGQALTSILLGLRALEDTLETEESRQATARLRELVVATLQDVRRLALELRPSALDDFGLVAAVEHLTTTFAEKTGMRVDFGAALGDERLPTEVDTALYRIVQESLTNIVKHARAQRVSIALTKMEGSVKAVVEDDGRGFDPAATEGGFGLVGMSERLALLGGRLRIESSPGAGTTIAAEVPLKTPGAGLSTRVLIVDDHAVVRAGLKLLVDGQKDLETVGEAGSARDAIFEARSLKPDIVLLDVVMPDQNGIEIVPQLLKENPESKVLVLSMQDEPRYVREAFEAGASGYVLKEAADSELVAAIREVAGGGRYVHPELGARLVAAESEERKRAEDDPLSDREREVLRLLALGHTNQEIAKQLYISVRTAETHRAHIMQKLRLQSRAELVRYALDQGLLEE